MNCSHTSRMRNPVARNLGAFRPKVVRSKKLYSRKGKSKWKLSNQKNLIDVILLLNSEKKLLTEKISRDLLIDALKQSEAEIIGKLFKINSQNRIIYRK